MDRFNAVFVEASKDADVAKRIRDLNSEPLGASRTEMAGMVRRDADIYGRIVKAVKSAARAMAAGRPR